MTQFEGFEVLAEVRRTSYSVTYQAKQVNENRLVFLKLCPRVPSNSEIHRHVHEDGNALVQDLEKCLDSFVVDKVSSSVNRCKLLHSSLITNEVYPREPGGARLPVHISSTAKLSPEWPTQ